MPQLTAVAPQLLVLPDTPPAKINGILIPDKARKPVNSGVIVSSFDGAELKEGEHVCFNHRQGYEVENLLSINEAYIVGIKTDNYMQPLHDRILVQPIKKDQSLSRGGVVLLEDPNIGEGLVLNVAMGTKDNRMFIQPNDKVIYLKHAGIEIDGHLFLNQTEVIAIIDKDGNTIPLHERILISPIKKGITKSKGGVLIGEDSNISEGLVLKVGTGKKDEPMMLTEGDKIIYPKHAGIHIGDELVLTQNEVIAITNENEEQ